MRRLLTALISALLASTVVLAGPAAAAVPSTPSIALDAATANSLSVSWSGNEADDPAVTYNATISPNDGAGAGALTSSALTSTTFTGLNPGTAYTVTVSANNVDGSTASGLLVSTRPAMASVVATANGSNQIDVSWSANDDGSNTYTTSISPAAGTGGVTASTATSTSYTGLNPNTAYTITVTPTNGTGVGTAGNDSATTEVALPVVTSVAAVTADSQTVNLSWAASNGGGTNTYAVTSSPVAGTFVSTGATTGRFEGLAPSTAYTFTVTPTNEAGTGTANSASATTDPPEVVAPSNPVISLGTVTSSSMVATFSADAGGGTNSYTLTVRSPDAGGALVQTIPGAVSPQSITGLSPATSYSVTMTADNGVAPAATAEASASTAAAAAGAPTGVSAVLAGPNGNFVTVSWVAPADDGGSAITGYTVTPTSGTPITVAGTSATFETLPAGTTVTFTVVANNVAGSGAPSAPSNSVTTANVPGPVTGLSASWAGATNTNAINVTWTAPTFDGGAGVELTGYVVTVSPEIENDIPVVNAGQTSATIGGLVQGVTYVVTVRAQNGLGNSAPVSSGSVLVPTTPGTVTNLVVQQSPPFSADVVLTWALPVTDGGPPITGYRVAVQGRAPVDLAPNVTTLSIPDLPPGDFNVTIRAITAAGLGPVVTSPNFEVKAFPPFDSEDAFVTQLYADFLKRTPDAGGLAFWTARVADDGSNLHEIAESFMRSPEFSPRRGVARLYFAYFNRQPDKGGFDFWTRQISSGAGSLENASQFFARSAEFQQTYGDLSDGEFVVLVYNNVLARRPDTDGYRFWLSQLGAGMARGRLMTLFSESPENIALSRAAVDVTVTYDGMLQREADPGGFIFWRDQIAGDVNALPSLIRQFYFSQEYADRVTR